MNMSEHTTSNVEVEAAELFVQRLHGIWSPGDEVELEGRLGRDPVFANAYARVEESWSSLDAHAETPELMRHREEAMAYARRANARRWLRSSGGAARGWSIAAAVSGIALVLGVLWQLSPMAYVPGQYRTGIGEQRLVELDDHSRIALDATTRLRVRYSKDARVVELTQGQAEFSVARDPARPFKVIAGDRTIIALGTVFTVDYADQQIRVATVEGRVAVASEDPPAPRPHATLERASADSRLPVPSSSQQAVAPEKVIELAAGEGLRVDESGRSSFTPKADLAAAIAWREGKVIFRTEALGDAVRRINRYSRIQVEVEDPSLAARRISGVFEMGDTQGFVSAVEQYLPVVTDRSASDRIRLRFK